MRLEGLRGTRSSLPPKMVWIPNPDRHFPHAIPMVIGILVLPSFSMMQPPVGVIETVWPILVILPMLSNGFAESTTAKLPLETVFVCLRPKVWQNPSICHGNLFVSSWWRHRDTRQNTKWQCGITCAESTIKSTRVHSLSVGPFLLAGNGFGRLNHQTFSLRPLFFCSLCP